MLIDKLCQKCIIGKDSPVFRPGHQQWHIGEVKSHDKETGKYLIRFLDGSAEWLNIERMPMKKYIQWVLGQDKRGSAGLQRFNSYDSTESLLAQCLDNDESFLILSPLTTSKALSSTEETSTSTSTVHDRLRKKRQGRDSLAVSRLWFR